MFDLETVPTELINIVTGLVAIKEVQASMTSCTEQGRMLTEKTETKQDCGS